jgi:hypothetical protein
MTQDPRMTARAAREGLAQGLQLLQTPGLPAEFMDAAEPIARAMSALMAAERSDGAVPSLKPHAESALTSLREALGKLQVIETAHPAAEEALQAVAGSLGHVHGLSRLTSQAPGARAAAPGHDQAPPQQPPQMQPAPQYQPPQYQPPPYQPAHHYQPPPAAPQFQAPPNYAPPIVQPPEFQPGAVHSPSRNPPPVSGADSLRVPAGTVEAELGAHSPSNFYKTLAGNDIVEHGGIFVATYNVPPLNQRVQLRVHLPGGYHFDATVVVRWIREGRDNPDAPPGFGAQFQGLNQEQRQLIMRYARNREPLFYDDL